MGLMKKIFKNDTDTSTQKTASDDNAKVVEVEKTVIEEPKKEEVKKESKASTTKQKTTKRDDMQAFRILSAPVITEKATDLAQIGKYIFAVPVKATKSQVIEKIENVYGVSPIKVNMINVTGKKVRRGRQWGKRNNWKKAIVTLPAGEKLEIYEGV